MGSFLYFAYGSNMLTERLRDRCPSATPIGPVQIDGHAHVYHKVSQNDGSGKATIIKSDAIQSAIYGVLFEVCRTDLAALNRAEGLGFGYDLVDILTTSLCGNDRQDHVQTYMAPATYLDQTLKPFCWYHAYVVAGARQHNLPASYVAGLQSAPWIRDANRLRSSSAARTIKQAGFADILSAYGLG